MKQYLDLMRLIRDKGVFKEDRTGTGTYSIFAHQMRFDLSEGFPLVSTKKCHLKSIIHELLWFLKGDTNIKYLQDNGVRIWDEWADENGDLGPVYGYQWRSWPDVKVVDQDTADALVNKGGFEDLGPLDSNIDGKGYCHHAAVRRGIDQIQNIIGMLKKGPDSRRIIVSAWNPALVEQMALPPCHALFQFYSAPMSIAERWELLKAQGGPSEKTYDRYREECEEMGYLRGPGISEERYDRNALEDDHRYLDNSYVPRRKLSCQLYQRKSNCALVA